MKNNFKMWVTKGLGLLFIIISIPLFFQNEFGEAITGILIGLFLILIPEKYLDILLYYTGIVFSVSAAIALKIFEWFSTLFTKGSKKASKSLVDISDRAAGHKTIKCPKCKSLDVQFLDNNRKSFSAGKAIGGTLLFGGYGGLAGFTGKKGKKNNWRCNECGTTFKK